MLFDVSGNRNLCVETTLLLEIGEVENVSSFTEHAFNNMLNTDKKE